MNRKFLRYVYRSVREIEPGVVATCEPEDAEMWGVYGKYCDAHEPGAPEDEHNEDPPTWRQPGCMILEEHIGDAVRREDALALVGELNELLNQRSSDGKTN